MSNVDIVLTLLAERKNKYSDEGWDSACNGGKEKNCPYDKTSKEGKLWLNGFKQGTRFSSSHE
jgi:ribosome modulation factor